MLSLSSTLSLAPALLSDSAGSLRNPHEAFQS